ncbi:large ribosomal subunit protein eL14-like [Oscarella lobularis]|uniref:large ribosomal subunit protein eL14-like n=1 Tax=Oscarella lobularis TaxID=121494 RepID=UPI00331424B1
MVFKRFVEIGRVAFITCGPDTGKLCVIVDLVDQKRALVDGPCSGVIRQALNIKSLALTDIMIKVAPSQGTSGIRRIWKANEVSEQWEKTSWAKRLAMKAKRVKATDFERFKIKVAKQQKSRVIRSKVKKLKKEAGAEGQ